MSAATRYVGLLQALLLVFSMLVAPAVVGQPAGSGDEGGAAPGDGGNEGVDSDADVSGGSAETALDPPNQGSGEEGSANPLDGSVSDGSSSTIAEGSAGAGADLVEWSRAVRVLAALAANGVTSVAVEVGGRGEAGSDGSAVAALILPALPDLSQIVSELQAADLAALEAATPEVVLPTVPDEDGSTTGLNVDELRALTTDVLALLDGRLPADLTTENLFVVNLRDPDQVRMRLESLAREIEGRQLVLDAPEVADGVDLERQRALNELAQARVRFLSSGERALQAVLDAEVRNRELRAEQQAANEAAERANAEAARARAAQEAALAAAREAATEIERQLATELARIERVRIDLAAFQLERSAAAMERANLLHERLERTFEFQERVLSVAPGSEDAVGLYDSIRTESATARQTLREALVLVDAPQVFPDFEPDELLLQSNGVSESQAAELRAQSERLVADIAAVREELQRQRVLNVREAAAYERLVEEQRILVLGRLPEDRRNAELGLGPDGIRTFQTEVDRLLLTLELARFRIRFWRGEFDNMLDVSALLLRLLLASLVLGVYVYLRRSDWPLLAASTAQLNRWARYSRMGRAAQTVLAAVSGVWPELLLWVTVMVVGGCLGDVRRSPLVALPWALAYWYVSYRLALASVHGLMNWIALQGTVRVTDDFSERLLRSLRTVGRYVFAVGTILGISRSVLGAGYLYNAVTSFAWVGLVPILYRLAQRWRRPIAEAYLAMQPTGVLADAVRQTRDRWFGVFVLVVAFAVLASFTLAQAARTFALGFEQTRRAIAWLFRRRIERHQATSAHHAVLLPPELDLLLQVDPEDDTEAGSELTPILDRFMTDLCAWRSEGRVGSFLLIADVGLGKSSCLSLAMRRAATLEDLPAHLVVLATRTTSAAALRNTLTERMELTDCESDEVLIAALLEGPSRIVFVDGLERLFLRGVLADEALQSLERVVNETGRHVYWFCTISSVPWEFLRWRKRANAFREQHTIRRWSEAAIERMLARRTAALGRPVQYDSLFNSAAPRTRDSVSRQAGTAADIARLLWDYSDGSPSVALYCWRHMLIPERDGSLAVRLFPQKDTNILESLSESERFVLACVVWHAGINEADVARALRYDHQTSRDCLRHLQERNIIVEKSGLMVLTVEWTAPVLRFLRRKHLIN